MKTLSKTYNDLFLVRKSDNTRFDKIVNTRFGRAFVNNGEFVSVSKKINTYIKKGFDVYKLVVTFEYTESNRTIVTLSVTSEVEEISSFDQDFDNITLNGIDFRNKLEKSLRDKKALEEESRIAKMLSEITHTLNQIDKSYFHESNPDGVKSIYIHSHRQTSATHWDIEFHVYIEEIGDVCYESFGKAVTRKNVLRKYHNVNYCKFNEKTRILTVLLKNRSFEDTLNARYLIVDKHIENELKNYEIKGEN